MELNLNEDSLNKLSAKLELVKGELLSLSSGISSIDVSGLKSGNFFAEVKDSIGSILSSNYDTNSIVELQSRINAIRSILEDDGNMNQWFTEIDKFSFDTFGNFLDFVGQVSLSNAQGSLDLEEYLKSNFADFVKLENGGYRVKNTRGQIFYFSEDCIDNDSVKLVTYYPGQGGGLKDSLFLRNELI